MLLFRSECSQHIHPTRGHARGFLFETKSCLFLVDFEVEKNIVLFRQKKYFSSFLNYEHAYQKSKETQRYVMDSIDTGDCGDGLSVEGFLS